MKKAMISALLLTLAAMPALADEGMWQPHQLPQLADRLAELGLEIDARQMTDLTAHPMNAIISLGGCTASFVSPEGLAITNHHCAYGALQYNSTEEANLMEDGFLARERADEVFAGPGSRILVTVSIDDVSAEVHAAAGEKTGRERFQAIETKEKELVAACEEDEGHRCRVASFHGGLSFYRIKQLEILDVRLVHAPAGPVGKFGGDIDNWMWPRHTGDYSFYRAYVGPDGKPAEHASENVPYRPRHFLKVSDKGLKPGDYVMVTGYPGRTSRYRLADEVESTFSWSYPMRIEALTQMLEIIDRETAGRPDAAIKYAGMTAGLNNGMKNNQGMIAGYEKSDIVARKKATEEALSQWIAGDAERQARYADTLDGLRQLVDEGLAQRERDFFYGMARRSSLLGAASTLYTLAMEGQKPNAERRPGFQERDLRRHKERQARLERTYDAQVDRALWRQGILDYAAIDPAQHVAVFDEYFGIDGNTVDEAKLDQLLDEMYAKTELGVTEKRLAWLDAEPAAFEASADPFVQLAVRLYPNAEERREEGETRAGRFSELRPKLMEAMIAFRESQGEQIYPDANSTLRVSFGSIRGYTPRDAVTYTPFTTVRGLLEKETGEDPFNSPPELLAAIREKRFGRYVDPRLGTVPVNFLADLDITGGNSGSPTLNGRGELVGLVFDGNWEAIIADWDFLPEITRSIHVDVRYILWVMDHVDGADHLIREMGLEAAEGQP